MLAKGLKPKRIALGFAVSEIVNRLKRIQGESLQPAKAYWPVYYGITGVAAALAVLTAESLTND